MQGFNVHAPLEILAPLKSIIGQAMPKKERTVLLLAQTHEIARQRNNRIIAVEAGETPVPKRKAKGQKAKPESIQDKQYARWLKRQQKLAHKRGLKNT